MLPFSNALLMAGAAAAPPYVAPDADYSMSVLMLALCGNATGALATDESASLHGKPQTGSTVAHSDTPQFIVPSGYRLSGGGTLADEAVLRYNHHADWNLGSVDFAILMMARIDTAWLGNTSTLIAHAEGVSVGHEWRLTYFGATNQLAFQGTQNGGTFINLCVATYPLTGDEEYDFLVEREGDTFRLWAGPVGGTMVCIASDNSHPGWVFSAETARLWIGCDGTESSTVVKNQLKGYIGEVEIYKGGTIRHDTASFPVRSTRSPRSVSPVATPAVQTPANVKLLLKGAGVDGNTVFTDTSPSARALTAVGNVQNDTGILMPGSLETILFDGVGDYITAANSADFDLTTGDFCLEGYARFATQAHTCTLMSRRPATSATAWNVDGPVKLGFSMFTGGNPTLSMGHYLPLATLTNYHWAVTRKGSIVRVFVNGIMGQCAPNASHTNNTQLLHIGRNPFNTGRDHEGSMNLIRITKGEHVYDGDFTPPTSF